ncbi:ABC transporter permease [Methylacidimicrobium tartarophylax]|uniref:Macrolide export ATP-binding/permease protein MacB n=1 Tax=Methylacidimicrobium tartarophylax TaxID=1041768 RepID=A0A5E6MBC3_9BACT|nr:FtsX-like permease family protein [Methylacidimicrobium tartarophylax]VVM05619.1 Macrolide export ATP-binding/permease protein MacB [Methylacidimicrobium tartarophylax]
MLALFLRHCGRQIARHPAMSAVTVLSVALGVALFIGVLVLNQSALAAFRASVDATAGKANLEVSGDGVPMDEEILRTVRSTPGIAAATPLVEQVCLVSDHPGEYLQLEGIDLFSNVPFRAFTLEAGGSSESDLLEFFRDPRAIALTATLAHKMGVRLGDRITVRTETGPADFVLRYLIEFHGKAVGADEHLALLDIASAQESFGKVGKLSRISCLLRKGADPGEVAVSLRRRLPPSMIVQTPEGRSRRVEKMLGAFELNLTALSLVSLFVAMYMIYNAVEASVVRRRGEIGLLRSLGLQRSGVQALFLGEALVVGGIGVLLGLPLGLLLARSLLGVISESVTAIYALLHIERISISAESIAIAAGAGLAAVTAAAWFPAREASGVEPVEAFSPGTLAEKSRRAGPWWAVAAVGCGGLALGLGWLALRTGPPTLSFGSALFALLGFTLLVPLVCREIARILRFRSVLPRLAMAHFAHSLHHNGITIAALLAALAMYVSVTVMIFSFRKTVDDWLHRTVTADLFVAPAINVRAGTQQALPPTIEEAVASLPSVAAYERYREQRILFRGETVKCAALRFPVAARYSGLSLRQGDARQVLAESAGADRVVVNESFAKRFHVREGDPIEIPTPRGNRLFTVAGVFYDYTTEFGLFLIDWGAYRRYWDEDRCQTLGLYLRPGEDPERVRQSLQRQIAPVGDWIVYSNREVRQEVFRVFDQTFTVTELLKGITLIVCASGIFLNFVILSIERRREIGVLRSIGVGRSGVEAMLVGEAALLGAIASLLGLLAGTALSLVLTYVINPSFFGWTVRWTMPWKLLWELPPLVILTAILSAYWPARRCARIPVAEAMRME